MRHYVDRTKSLIFNDMRIRSISLHNPYKLQSIFRIEDNNSSYKVFPKYGHPTVSNRARYIYLTSYTKFPGYSSIDNPLDKYPIEQHLGIADAIFHLYYKAVVRSW